MQQATVNLFADMGVQPSTLQSGLTAATASTDTLAPVTTILSPANGATVSSGAAITLSGTATDTGGIVAAVEVSIDGGTTWSRATGRTSWTFTCTAGAVGTMTLRSRGIDDSGNIENPGASRTITVSGGGGATGLVAAYAFDEGTGTAVADTSGRGNNGTISGATWVAGRNGSGLSFNGTSAMVDGHRLELARSDDGHDDRGLGQAGDAEQLADGRDEGAHERPRLRPLCARRQPAVRVDQHGCRRSRCVRRVGAEREHLEPRRRDLRRHDAAALRQRHPDGDARP